MNATATQAAFLRPMANQSQALAIAFAFADAKDLASAGRDKEALAALRAAMRAHITNWSR